MMELRLDNLPQPITGHLFQYLSVPDLRRLCMASKILRDFMFSSHFLSECFIKRLSIMLIDSSANNVMHLHAQCRRIANLAKISSLTFATSRRATFFHQFTHQIRQKILVDRPLFPQDSLLRCVGLMLRTFTTAWHPHDRIQIYVHLSSKLHITDSMVYFIDNDMSCNPENQLFLRNHMRCLFLDPFASDLGKLVWLDYICADYICAKGLAKLILLLYSPMTTSDTSTYMISDFAIYSESFHMFTNAFVSMAHTIGLLKFIQNESPALPLQVLNFLIDVPDCWSLTSIASILLSLTAFDMKLVVDFFLVLFQTGQDVDAYRLVAVILSISPHFISATSLESTVTKDKVRELITSIVNNVKLSNIRSTVIREIWEAVVQRVRYLLSSIARDQGRENSAQRFKDLMKAWISLAVLLMKD